MTQGVCHVVGTLPLLRLVVRFAAPLRVAGGKLAASDPGHRVTSDLARRAEEAAERHVGVHLLQNVLEVRGVSSLLGCSGRFTCQRLPRQMLHQVGERPSTLNFDSRFNVARTQRVVADGMQAREVAGSEQRYQCWGVEFRGQGSVRAPAGNLPNNYMLDLLSTVETLSLKGLPQPRQVPAFCTRSVHQSLNLYHPSLGWPCCPARSHASPCAEYSRMFRGKTRLLPKTGRQTS